MQQSLWGSMLACEGLHTLSTRGCRVVAKLHEAKTFGSFRLLGWRMAGPWRWAHQHVQQLLRFASFPCEGTCSLRHIDFHTTARLPRGQNPRTTWCSRDLCHTTYLWYQNGYPSGIVQVKVHNSPPHKAAKGLGFRI